MPCRNPFNQVQMKKLAKADRIATIVAMGRNPFNQVQMKKCAGHGRETGSDMGRGRNPFNQVQMKK